ncbi:MAG: methylamine utilization protein [Candidatus Binatia bacterium]
MWVLLFTAVAPSHAAEVKGRVVDEHGSGIPQAVVFVKDPPTGAAQASPRTAVLDQINKQFSPSVLPIAIGTEVRFPNHDQLHHHVYSFSRPKSFNLPLYKGEEVPSVVFDQIGVVDVGCNIHDWMSAVILVLPSTLFAITDETGQFTLTDLPSGTYALVAWHQRSTRKLDDTTQQVHVTANTPHLSFTLSLKPAQDRPATHGQRGY